MSLFSNNRHSSLYENYEFSDIDGYGGSVAPLMAIVEGYQNDLTLMTLAVQSDTNEIMAVNEGSDIVALQEAGISGMFEAIKQFFIKLGQKIKAIFTKFMAKLDQYFMSDTKAFVKKYDKILRDRNYENMSCKFSKPKIDPPIYEIIEKGKSVAFLGNNIGLTQSISSMNTAAENIKNADKSRTDILEELYNEVTSNKADNKTEFEEWYHEQVFEDEEAEDNWDYSKIKPLCNFLEDSKKTMNKCESSNKSLQKAIKTVIDSVEKMQKQLSSDLKSDAYDKNSDKFIFKYKNTTYNRYKKLSKDNNGKYIADDKENFKIYWNNYANATSMQRVINYLRTEASCTQEVILVYCNCIMKELKFHIAQCKRVIATAVQQKSGTSESSLLKAVGDVAFDEVYEYFDSESV